MTTMMLRPICAFVIIGLGTNAAAVELIRNGSFEHDGFTTARVLTGWNDGRGLGLNVLEYPFGDCGDVWCGGTEAFESPGPPSGGVSGPVNRGNLYGYAFSSGFEVDGKVDFSGFASQHIDLTAHVGMPFRFSAWLASRILDGDYAIVTLELHSEPDGAGALLGSVVFDGNDVQSPYIVGSANVHGLADPTVAANQNNWTFYRTSGIFPPAAMSASVKIEGRSANATGFVNDGYVDLLSLQVVPEPSSAVLACVLGAIGAICHVRRKIRYT